MVRPGKLLTHCRSNVIALLSVLMAGENKAAWEKATISSGLAEQCLVVAALATLADEARIAEEAMAVVFVSVGVVVGAVGGC